MVEISDPSNLISSDVMIDNYLIYSRSVCLKALTETEEQLENQRRENEINEYIESLQKILKPYCENVNNINRIKPDMFSAVLGSDPNIDTIIDMTYGSISNHLYEISSLFPKRFNYIKSDRTQKLSKTKRSINNKLYLMQSGIIQDDKIFNQKNKMYKFCSEENIEVISLDDFEFIERIASKQIDGSKIAVITPNREFGYLINYMIQPALIFYEYYNMSIDVT